MYDMKALYQAESVQDAVYLPPGIRMRPVQKRIPSLTV